MEKYVLLITLLMLVMPVANAKNRYTTRYTPNYPEQYCSFANQDKSIAQLENRVLNRTYAYDTTENRISRIEQKLFGASQSGDLQKRLANVKRASSNKNRNYGWGYQNYDNYYAPPIVAGSGWKSMLHSFGNSMMGGVPTGITPQMDPAYMDYFEAERNAMKYGDGGESRDIRTNHGYRSYDTKRGSSTGITILD